MKTLSNKSMVLYAIFCLTVSAGFIALHLATPSDGTRLNRGYISYTPEGAILSAYSGVASPLKDGDILVAVEGITIKDRARSFFLPVPGNKLSSEKSLEYTIIRNGKEIKLSVPQVRFPLRAVLAENWGLLLFFLLSQGVVSFVYSQKPSDPAARLLFLWAFSGSHTYSWIFFLQASDLVNGSGFWLFRAGATGLWLVFWVTSVHLLLIFPSPLLDPRTMRKWLPLLYASPFTLFGIFLGLAWLKAPDILTWYNSIPGGEFFIAAVYTLLAILLLFVQRVSVRSDVERKKIRLVIYGGWISTCLGLVLYFLPALILNRTFLNSNGLGLINLPFIIGLTLAVWRYHLFDIDVIIRKTLVYALLSGMLGVVYFGGVALLQGILTADSVGYNGGLPTAVSGQPSAVVIIATTLAIAALANPLRHRLQEAIDRRYYRQKYDTEKALLEFAAVARSETDLKQLSSRLTSTVQETLQPELVGLWLKPTAGKRPAQPAQDKK